MSDENDVQEDSFAEYITMNDKLVELERLYWEMTRYTEAYNDLKKVVEEYEDKRKEQFYKSLLNGRSKEYEYIKTKR